MTTARVILLILSIATVSTVLANNYKNPPTRTDTYDHAIRITAGADVLDIINGDTIRVSAHMWPGHQWTGLIRFAGLDAPELRRSKCQAEKDQGIMARDTLVSLIPPRVLLVNIRNGSFANRYVAAVMDGTRNLAHVLMENGVGRPYYGKGKRKPWCNESNESIRERHKRMTPRQDTAAPRGYQVQSLLASLGTKDRVTKGSFPPSPPLVIPAGF